MLPPPRQRDAAARVALALLVAYLAVPSPGVQYSAWLILVAVTNSSNPPPGGGEYLYERTATSMSIFCVWVAWFVSSGARWLYGDA
jgi:hypothetical protein